MDEEIKKLKEELQLLKQLQKLDDLQIANLIKVTQKQHEDIHKMKETIVNITKILLDKKKKAKG